MNLEEAGVIPLFETVFDRMSKDEHHRDVPARERVLKRGMAHGSDGGQSLTANIKRIAGMARSHMVTRGRG